jgi:hypothetical protein
MKVPLIPSGYYRSLKKGKTCTWRHFKKCKCLKRWAYQPITLGEATYNYTKQGVCHIVASPFTLLKSILRQKKNDGNSNVSPCKNIILKKSSKRN